MLPKYKKKDQKDSNITKKYKMNTNTKEEHFLKYFFLFVAATSVPVSCIIIKWLVFVFFKQKIITKTKIKCTKANTKIETPIENQRQKKSQLN